MPGYHRLGRAARLALAVLRGHAGSRALDADSLGAAWTRRAGLVKGSWGFAAGALLLTFLILVVVNLALSVVFSAVLGVGMAGAVAGDPAEAMGLMGWVYAPLQWCATRCTR